MTSPPPPPPHLRFERLLLFLCWTWWGAMFVKYAIIDQLIFEGVDFPKHYWAAVEIMQGNSPFVDSPNYHLYLGFNYPQFTAWIYLFLGFFTLEQAEGIWDGLNMLYTAASLILVARWLRPRPSPRLTDPTAFDTLGRGDRIRWWMARHWPSICAWSMAAFAPSFISMRAGNIEHTNQLILIGFLVALSARRDAWAGALLAALSLGKMLPVFFIIPLALAGRRRVVGAWAGVLALYGIALLVSGWWRAELFLFTDTLPKIGYYWRGISASLVCLLGDLFFPALMESERAFSLTAQAIAGTILTLSLAAIGACWQWGRYHWRDGLSLLRVAVVLMTPLLEYHHYIWALPAYFFWIHRLVENDVDWRYWLWEMFLWINIFAWGYIAVIRPPFPIPHSYVSTLFALTLWLSKWIEMLTRRLFSSPSLPEERE